MIKLSRRQLARYATEQLLSGKDVGLVAKELAAVLIQNRRQDQAELLASDIAWELEQHGQTANARVTSATALSDDLRRQIRDYVKKAAKVDSVILDEQLDESVIGGLRIDTAGRSWDMTLKRKLTDIQETF